MSRHLIFLNPCNYFINIGTIVKYDKNKSALLTRIGSAGLVKQPLKNHIARCRQAERDEFGFSAHLKIVQIHAQNKKRNRCRSGAE